MLESSCRIALRVNPASTRSKLHVFGRRHHKARPVSASTYAAACPNMLCLHRSLLPHKQRSLPGGGNAVHVMLLICGTCGNKAAIAEQATAAAKAVQLRIAGVAAHQVILILQKTSRIRHQPCGRRRVDAGMQRMAAPRDNVVRSSKMSTASC